MIEQLLGLERDRATPQTAVLAGTLEQNGPRQHYMRATYELNSDGETRVAPVRSQDSSLMAPLSQADCLIVRAPKAPAARSGETVEILPWTSEPDLVFPVCFKHSLGHSFQEALEAASVCLVGMFVGEPVEQPFLAGFFKGELLAARH